MGRNRGNGEKSHIRILVAAAVFLITFAAAVFAMQKWENITGVFKGESFAEPTESSEVIRFDGKDYSFKKNTETLLIMGLDKFTGTLSDKSYNNNTQTDFIMLLVFDNSKKTYTALQFNRDTMIEMPIIGVDGKQIGTTVGQAALAYTYGTGGKDSCTNTRDAVSSFLMGIKIDKYVSFTMDAVGVVTDKIGGVEVLVTDDFSEIDDTLVMGKRVVLNSGNALNFVRSRGGLEDSSNEARMKRQQEYISALHNKAAEKRGDKNFVADVLLSVNEYMVSDCSVNKINDYFNKTTEYEFLGIRQLSGETQIGKNKEFYADGESLLSTVTELFCEPAE